MRECCESETEAETESSNDIYKVLASITTPANFKVLATPNVWIANARATTHSTLHNTGFSNKKKASNNDCVTAMNWVEVASKAMGDVKGIVTTKTGQEVAKVMLREVAYAPQSKSILLSLTKLMKEW